MTEKIFLSYAHEDRDLVKGVLGTLRKHRIVTGNDVVILDPHDFVPGTDVRTMIRDQINSASKVVIIATDHSANSEWVNYEAGMATALGKPIVVMGRKGSGKTASLISALGNVQSIEIGGRI
ncbi:MAG: toll/interleukin-1 receptor domain-containing protein [Pyrinomonadaceae bacterium]